MVNARVVVMGASKGGVAALMRIVRDLPPGFSAPICVVLHIGAHRSILPQILSTKGALPAVHPHDGQKLENGRIFVAPPDCHMRLEADVVRLVKGPKEHHTRPAIDPLFRSAAQTYGERAVGVVLTGLLDDGTPGMQAIKQHGGICVVQDPEEAEEPSMPLSVLKHVAVDHRARLDEMPALLATLVTSAPPRNLPMPTSSRTMHEEALFSGTADAIAHLREIGAPSTFACPDCKGTLWQVADTRPPRFRCHTGHAFTLGTLQHAQAEATDGALWNAIRALQEKKLLTQAALEVSRDEGDEVQAAELMARINELEAQARSLQGLTRTVNESDP